MVFTSSRLSATNNKENALIRAPFHVKRSNPNTNRNRSSSSTHPQKASPLPPPLQSSFGKRAEAKAVDTCLDSLMNEHAAEEEDTGDKSSGQTLLRLPRRLLRPLYRPISPEALAAIDPDLAEVPVEYIGRKLLSFAELLYAMTTRVTPRYTGGKILPKELEIVRSDDIVPAAMPTHIAVVYAPVSPSSNKRIVSLYPVHALVLATQCAHIPPSSYCLQPGRPEDKGDNTQTLPVLPLRIPSPRTFPLLLQYLYAHQIKIILSALIPVPSQDNVSPQELSLKLSQSCTTTTLLFHVATIYEMWRNIAALGIFDENLWQAVELSWTVVLAALEMKPSKPMAAAAAAATAATS